MQRLIQLAAPVAALLWAIAVFGLGARFDAFSHLQHPVGLPGATRVPGAALYNSAAFVVPGLLSAAVPLVLRERLRDAGLIARLGAQALLLSALAFAAQGLLPLDSDAIDGVSSRLHASAWTAWWVASVVGAILIAAGRRRTSATSATAAPLLLLAVATCLLAVIAPAFMPAGLAQRLAIAAWFGAIAGCARLSRAAA